MTPFQEGYQNAIKGKIANETICMLENLLAKNDVLLSGPTSYREGYRVGTREAHEQIGRDLDETIKEVNGAINEAF